MMHQYFNYLLVFPKDKSTSFRNYSVFEIVLVFDKWWKQLSLWWSLEPHCSLPAPCLASPCRIVWFCVQRLDLHTVSLLLVVFVCPFVELVDILSSLICPLHFLGWTQTVWLMDTLLVWLINQVDELASFAPSLSISVSRNISVPLTPVSFQLWCNQLKLAKTGSAVTPPSWSHLQ